MGNNKRKLTKIGHSLNDNKSDKRKASIDIDDETNIIYNSSYDLSIDEKNYILLEYINKHFKINDKLFNDSNSKLKVYYKFSENGREYLQKAEYNGSDEDVYFKKGNIESKVTLISDKSFKKNSFKCFSIAKDGSRKKISKDNNYTEFRKIEDDELNLLLYRKEFYTQLNKLYSNVCSSANIDLTNFTINYDDKEIEELIEYIIKERNSGNFKKDDENFEKVNVNLEKENKKFIDGGSKDLYTLMINACTKRIVEQKFIRFLVELIESNDNKNDAVLKFKQNFVEIPNNVLNATFNNKKYKKENTVNRDNNINFNDDDVNFALGEFKFDLLEGKVKDLVDNSDGMYRDILISKIRTAIKDVYNESYENFDALKEDYSKKYVIKVLNNYIKSRTNKILKAHPNNEFINKKLCIKYAELFDKEHLKPKVKNAILNKYLYKENYKHTESFSIQQKQAYKANMSLSKKLVNNVDDFVYNFIVKSSDDVDIFGNGNDFENFESKVEEDVRNGINKLNSEAVVHFEKPLYPIYVLRTFLYHFETSTGIFEAKSRSNEENIATDKDLNKKLTEFSHKDIIIEKYMYMINKELYSNSCYKYYTEEEINKIVKTFDINKSKAHILPRFSKVYNKLLSDTNLDFNKDIKEADDTKKHNLSFIRDLEKLATKEDSKNIKIFQSANMVMLKLLYENGFSNQLKEKELELEKSESISRCLGNEEKIKKAEQNFVTKITKDFWAYIQKFEFLLENKKMKELVIAENEFLKIDRELSDKEFQINELKILSACLIYILPFIRQNMLARLKGDISKYRSFVITVENTEAKEMLFFDEKEIDFILRIIEIEIENRKDIISQKFITSKDIDEESDIKFSDYYSEYKGAFSVLTHKNSSSTKIEYKYKAYNKNNQKYENKTQDIFVEDITQNSRQFIAYSSVVDIFRYGHLEMFKRLNSETLSELNFDLNKTLEEFGKYKSVEEAKKMKKLTLADLSQPIDPIDPMTNIQRLTNEREQLFIKLKEEFYKKVQKNKGIEVNGVISADGFNLLLKEYNTVNEEYLEYNYMNNVLYLNTLTKAYNLFSELNSRLLSWKIDLHRLVIDDENNPDSNYVTPIITNKTGLGKKKYIKINNNIFNDARHYNMLKVDKVKGFKCLNSNMFSYYFGDKSIDKIQILTNFKNDVEMVYKNILNDYNIIVHINKKDISKSTYKARKHKLFNNETLQDVFNSDIRFNEVSLICKKEVKYMSTMLSKIDFKQLTDDVN